MIMQPGRLRRDHPNSTRRFYLEDTGIHRFKRVYVQDKYSRSSRGKAGSTSTVATVTRTRSSQSQSQDKTILTQEDVKQEATLKLPTNNDDDNAKRRLECKEMMQRGRDVCRVDATPRLRQDGFCFTGFRGWRTCKEYIVYVPIWR